MKANMEPQAIETMLRDFVKSLPVTDDAYYQEAAIKFIIREFAWALHERFPDMQYEIADQLGDMGMAVQNHKEK